MLGITCRTMRRWKGRYERHGYERAGRLRNFARDGIDEIIMYKLHKANS